MSADTYYASKRAAEGRPWRSGFCGARVPLDHPSHAHCAGGYERKIQPIGWAPCVCDCHTQAPVEEGAPIQPSTPDAVLDVERSIPSSAGQPTTAGEESAIGLESDAGVQPPPVVVTEPCVMPGLDELVYHGDPVPERLGRSLSHSGAKVLLGETPAFFQHQREHGRPAKKAFDFGHAAHTKVLGVGAPIAVIDGNRNRNDVKEAIAEAEARGETVLKPEEMAKVEAMANRLHEHPIAGKLLAGEGLDIELSVFWQDASCGVFRRARYDVARFGRGRPVIVDYKSCIDASRDGFLKAVIDHGYYTQDPWYCDGAAALDLADPAELGFVFIAQEKEPPYQVAIYELKPTFKQIGRQQNRRALDLYAECQSSGIWPSYPEEPSLLAPPPWFTKRHEEFVA